MNERGRKFQEERSWHDWYSALVQAIPPLTQYALGINSTEPIICQFGRVDTTQSANAYYVGVGWAE